MPFPDTADTDAFPRVGVVTVSYGSGDALRVFLETLRSFHGSSIPVAVVDNKPDHENVESLTHEFGAHYLPLATNPGYGAGMNAGARLLDELSTNSTFDAFFFCNPDLRFVEPVIESLVLALFNEPRAGSIGPCLLNDDGTVYPSARQIPSVGTGVGHALLSKIWPTNPWTRTYQDSAHYDARRAAGSLSGAAVMVKRSVFEAILGWDEEYFMHFEDIDLGWRIGNAGYVNIYEPAVKVEHSGAHSTKKYVEVVERAMTQSAIRFISKRYAGFWRSPLRWSINAGLMLRGFLKIAGLHRTGKERNAS